MQKACGKIDTQNRLQNAANISEVYFTAAEISEGKGKNEMLFRRFFVKFAIVFSIAFLTLICITFLWNLMMHHRGTVNWEISAAFSIVYGIVIGLIEVRRKRQ